jgi:membrane protein implicated in regulation of membrane protease activity
MKLSKINIFKPESFLVFYIGFLALAGAGFVYWKNIGKPTLFGIGFVILSLLTFYLGLTLSKKFKRKKIHPYLSQFLQFIIHQSFQTFSI